MVELSEFASILLLSVKKRSCLSLSTTFQIQLNRTTACLEYPCVYAGKSWLYGTALQYSCLENPMDGGAWWAAVHGVAMSRRQLSDFTFTFHFHALEKEMATLSSVLAWRIPGTGEPDVYGVVQSRTQLKRLSSSSSSSVGKVKQGIYSLHCLLWRSLWASALF